MQNTLLSASLIANLGCAMGNEHGFSACEIWTERDGLRVRWCQIGDRKWDSESLRFLGSDDLWAYAYNEEVDFSNSIREFEEFLPDILGILLGTIDTLRGFFCAALAKLEIEYQI